MIRCATSENKNEKALNSSPSFFICMLINSKTAITCDNATGDVSCLITGKIQDRRCLLLTCSIAMLQFPSYRQSWNSS